MINNFFYIFIICAFTNTLAKDEDKEPQLEEITSYTKDYYENEGGKDLEYLFSSFGAHRVSENNEDYNEPYTDELRSHKLMETIDQAVNELEIKHEVRNALRNNAQITTNNFQPTHMHNLPVNHRNTKSNSIVHNHYTNNGQFLKPKIRLISTARALNLNKMLRRPVTHINLKPEVYPLSSSEEEYDGKEIAEHIVLTNEYALNDRNILTKHLNTNTVNNNELFTRTATAPKTESFHLNENFKPLHSYQTAIRKGKESNNNLLLQEFLKKLHSQSAKHIRSNNRMECTLLDKFQDKMDVKNKDPPKTIYLRNDVIEKSDSKEKFDEFMKYLKMGKASITFQNRLANQQSNTHIASNDFPFQAKQGRSRRSTITQAGYTQDPDTCKTYNENLVKLWSNLSKYINVTEQPNEKALHNIAIMIQAYLEHQNGKLPESYKTKHEGPRDKITAAMFKIKRLIDKDEGSAEKLTKIIMKYLKPNYVDVQSKDCQKVNEETLASSVDLLYKTYLENILNCNSDDMAGLHIKTEEALSNVGHHTVNLNPEIHTILIEDELLRDLQKGKIPRQKLINRIRRFLRPTRKAKHRFRPAIFRTGIKNESVQPKLQATVPQVFASKKIKLKSQKSHLADNCEKYSVRELIVSLRPAMERYVGLFECEHDNTLRSEKFSQVLNNPYYLYVTKRFPKYDLRRQRKILSRLLPTYIGRKRNASRKKIYTERHDTSVEIVQNGLEHSGEADSAWLKIYRLDNIKGIKATRHAVTSNTGTREPETRNNKQQHNIHDFIKTHNKHFQSQILNNDYTKHGFPSLINQNKKYKSTLNKLPSSNKRNDFKNDYSYEYTHPDENSSEELSQSNEYTVDQQNVSNLNAEGSFMDLTKLGFDDQITEKEKKVQNLESIAEFLKKARDTSLQAPEFAVPFALDTNKGYVELTHLIKYPKMLVYRPQFLVKNTMPYDDFLKTIDNITLTSDEVRLMKIVRHLPNSSVQVLFESEDFDPPFEIQNLNDKKGTSSPDPLEANQFESGIDTASTTKADTRDENKTLFVPSNHNKAYTQITDAYVNSISSSTADDFKHRDKEELSSNTHSDLNLAKNVSGFMATTPSSDSNKGVDSDVGRLTESDMDIGLGPTLVSDSNTTQSSQLGSFHEKLLPYLSNTQFISNPILRSESHINSYSNSPSKPLSSHNSYSQMNLYAGSLTAKSGPLRSNTDSYRMEVGKSISPSPNPLLRWWKLWKKDIDEKIKQLIGKLASLAENIDHIDQVQQ